MKPAISVLLLTTLIGAGQGLFLAYYSAEWLVLLNILPLTQSDYGGEAAGLSFLLLAAGLLASFFHLGHPERAWRAAAMWRSSWLSREVIALPAAMALILAYALTKLTENDPLVFSLGSRIPLSVSMLAGFGAVLAVCALFVCTAMIYACLRFLRQWHSPLTVLNFILMGCASGFTLATVLAAFTEDTSLGYFSGMAIFLTIAALLSRYASLSRNRRLRSPSSLQSAIGVHHPSIRQLAQGAMGGSFNTRAFIHNYGTALLRLVRRGFILLAFVAPVVLLLVASPATPSLLVIAFALQYIGLLAERWYFFIEAEHPQNIYYQMIS
ncbi:MAG: dimethyl sulfoxide reductase anchor subunit [Gammaproteobacteria bacterium]|nr:dimethyl sulfoxide reductase anchor subunit [Gammaproteobacteria bacterium]MDH3447644.1 dimethyl sulfoxide reductase anchor subunit [Gammaproteobacteria bacterium]